MAAEPAQQPRVIVSYEVTCGVCPFQVIVKCEPDENEFLIDYEEGCLEVFSIPGQTKIWHCNIALPNNLAAVANATRDLFIWPVRGVPLDMKFRDVDDLGVLKQRQSISSFDVTCNQCPFQVFVTCGEEDDESHKQEYLINYDDECLSIFSSPGGETLWSCHVTLPSDDLETIAAATNHLFDWPDKVRESLM